MLYENKMKYVKVSFKMDFPKYKKNKEYILKKVIAEKYLNFGYLNYMIPTKQTP